MYRSPSERLSSPGFRLTTFLLLLLLAPAAAYGQDRTSTWKSDLDYLRYTLWEDAKTVARPPLEISKVREVTPEQVLIGSLVVSSIGGKIALDSRIREGARDIDDSSVLTLQHIGVGVLAGSLVSLYGAGLWMDNEQWQHAALTGVESTLVSWGVANLAKLTFGRERPDAGKGPEAWFRGGDSFVSGDATPAFAMAEAVAAATSEQNGTRLTVSMTFDGLDDGWRFLMGIPSKSAGGDTATGSLAASSRPY